MRPAAVPLLRSSRTMAPPSSRLNMLAKQLSTTAPSQKSTKELLGETQNSAPVLFTENVGLRTFTLNRPKALNALDGEMIDLIKPKLEAWEKSPSTSVIVSAGAGKAYCAGGDVKAIAVKDDPSFGTNYFRNEFELDYQLSTLEKPYVAVIDGFVMGGGAGLSLPAPLRVSTDNTVFAFPETKIGYSPDVGATYYLSRLDGEIGTYLALTSNTVSGADVYHLGLSTHHVSAQLLPSLLSRISDFPGSPSLPALSDALDEFATAPLPRSSSPFAGPVRAALDSAFSRRSVEEIFAALEELAKNESQPEVAKWANETRETLELRSPTSLKVALESVRRGRNMRDVGEALQQEFRFAEGFVRKEATPDFKTGVTALLVERSKGRPAWQPSTVSEVPSSTIRSAFFDGPPKSGPLNLPKDRKPSVPHPATYALPAEAEIEAYVRGNHPASGGSAVTADEVVRFFERRRRGKVGIAEKVREVLERRTEKDEGGYLTWV